MTPASGGVSEYRVYAFDAADIELRRFRGGGAFAAAFECYHRLTADPGFTRLWLTRRDGRALQFVGTPVRRNGAGEWEPDPEAGAPGPAAPH